MRQRRRSTLVSIAAAGAAVLLSGCGNGGEPGGVVEQTTAGSDAGRAARAVLRTADGTEVGIVQFSEVSAGTEVVAEVDGLEPGFYGFHVHAAGRCEPDSAAPGDPGRTGDFLSAGGHLGADAGEHPGHAGDLTSLHVTGSGQGRLLSVTDRFEVDDLTADDDGTAVMLHAGPDNFANVPERYAPEGPDRDTLGTGDAGSRLACGVVE